MLDGVKETLGEGSTLLAAVPMLMACVAEPDEDKCLWLRSDPRMV